MRTSIVCWTLLISSPALADEAEERGLAIAKELVLRNSGFGDQSVKIHMQLQNAQGQEATREIRVKALEDGATPYTLIIFDSPNDVKGTALLVHGEDQWLFLPAAGQERRISSSNRSGPFAGSEFAYEDLMVARPSDYTWKHVGTEPCDGASCDKVESRPKDDRSGYSRRVLFIESGSRRIHRIDFFDKKDALLKTLTYGEHKTFRERFDRALLWTMKNHQNGKSTVLRFDDFKFDNGLTTSDFSAARLKSVR